MSEWKDALLEIDTPSTWPAIDCGDGWRPLVEAFYALVVKHPCLSVSQVKEKFGELRLYYNHEASECKYESWDHKEQCMRPDPTGHWEHWQGIVSGLECASIFTCESCGKYAVRAPQPGRYTKTLCEGCRG